MVNENKKEEVKIAPKVESVVVDNATPATTFEEREKIEKEVEMIKVGRDASGNWKFKRSDRLTAEDKKQRESLLEKIKKGLNV
jgi:hypothetical protein